MKKPYTAQRPHRILCSVGLAIGLLITAFTAKAQYCTPSTDCSAGDFIDNFSFNTLSNKASGCGGGTGGYTYYNSAFLTTTVTGGSSYSLTLQSGSATPQAFAVWIDYNADGDFDDPGEMIYASPSVGSAVFSTNILIPLAVTPGQTRMRVRSATSIITATQSCTNWTDGETEDYNIILKSPADMRFSKLVVTQIVNSVFKGQANAKILCVDVKMLNPGKPLKATKLVFNTKGTTATSDLLNAKLYFVANTDYSDLPFAISDTAGQAIAKPNGKLVFKTNRQLAAGDNYFWLTYDISSLATIGDAADATIDTVVVADTVRIPSPTNPIGNALIGTSYSYCPVKVTTGNGILPAYIGLTSVKIGNAGNMIDNTTADLDKLTFYPSQKISVYRQESYPVHIQGGQGNTEQIIGWVDWNNDGYYDPVSEQVFYSAGTGAGATYNGTLTVPCNTTAGQKRMRIMSDFAGMQKLAPCADLTYGDAEEYLVDVQPDMMPVAHFSSDTPYYVNSPVVFNNTSTAHGSVKYEWDFDNNGIYDSTSYDGRFTYTSTGKKKIKLRLTFKGCDSTVIRTFLDSVTVINPLNRPVSGFFADRNVTNIYDEVYFTDLSTGRPNKWTWTILPDSFDKTADYYYIKGTSASSPNPVVIFNRPGSYTVSLTTYNGAGKGSTLTKTDYIFVGDNVSMCSSDTVRTNDGFLYDDGGEYGPYSSASAGSQKVCGMVISPPCAKSITLTFNKFDVSSLNSSGGDYLRIYDGKNNSGIPLHALAGYPSGFQNKTGTNTPIIPPKLVANSGSMYIEWIVDDGFVGDGFEAQWTASLFKTSPPKASFTGPATIYQSQIASFKNTSTGSKNTYLWDMDGDGYTDFTTANAAFPYLLAGKYRVRLVVINCGGADTAYNTLTVLAPTSKPHTDFVANYTRVNRGDIVAFTDLSTQQPYIWKWTISSTNPNANPLFISGSAGSQNPSIQFNDTGHYTIQLYTENDLGSDIMQKTSYIIVIQSCTPIVQKQNADVGITNVTLQNNFGGTLISQNSASGQDPYAAFSYASPPILEFGGQYRFTAARATNYNDMDAKVWIDFNNDGDFDDPGENVISLSQISGTSWGKYFVVPQSGITSGLTRMRVGVNYSGQPLKPCGINFAGEYEDYSVAVIPDLVLPVITMKGKDTVWLEQGRSYRDSGATAFDDVDGDITSSIQTFSTVDTSLPRNYYVTYNVMDRAGNKAKQAVRVVKVFPDTTPPSILLTGGDSVFVQVHNPYIELGAIATDNIPSLSIQLDISGSVDTSKVGLNLVKYTATDDQTNMAVKYRKVYVGDSIPPTLSLLGKDTVRLQLLTRFLDPGTKAADNYWKTVSIIRNYKLDSSKIGTYIITYTAKDGSGNLSAPLKRVVLVNDYVKPVLKLAEDSIFFGVKNTFSGAAYTVTDNYYPIAQLKVFSKGTVDADHLGRYVLRYYATDPSGNVSDTEVFVVYVVDTVAPQISLIGDPLMYVERWHNFDDPGIGKSDNYDPDPDVIIKGNLDTQLPGHYWRSYQLKDQSDNYSIKIVRYIDVTDSNTGIENTRSLFSSFKFYPNPANDRLYLDFSLLQSKEVSIEILNMLGQPVKHLWEGQTSGKSMDADISSLSSGVYFIRYTVGDQVSTSKLIINR
jgi:PKD repeat protein